jgi:hypothetical protein
VALSGEVILQPFGLPMFYIGFTRLARPVLPTSSGERAWVMTYLDVVFRYGAPPGETELRAIDAMREVYGIRSVVFNEKESTVRVEFDASRLKQEAVARMLRQAGVDVREPLALA